MRPIIWVDVLLHHLYLNSDHDDDGGVDYMMMVVMMLMIVTNSNDIIDTCSVKMMRISGDYNCIVNSQLNKIVVELSV